MAKLTHGQWVQGIVEKGFNILLRNLNPDTTKAFMRNKFTSFKRIGAKQPITKNLDSFWKKSATRFYHAEPRLGSDCETFIRAQEQSSIKVGHMDINSVLTVLAIHNLTFWKVQLKTWNGWSFLPETFKLEIFTDSSNRV
ncbi:hypothetical protein BB561_002895 [Smittium simulii]|uniref:Uncharacterized protein n=1 Tax=Smittium simulii TaxID=133385 RepID=A0A2T9YNW8_9FUNG|nr:hypothetical protein BB561_002895 [Smittium simulii]